MLYGPKLVRPGTLKVTICPIYQMIAQGPMILDLRATLLARGWKMAWKGRLQRTTCNFIEALRFAYPQHAIWISLGQLVIIENQPIGARFISTHKFHH